MDIVTETPSRPLTPNTLKRLRFAEVKESDVHVYESQPSSPKKQALALLPAPVGGDPSAVPLPQRKTSIPFVIPDALSPTSGDAEDAKEVDDTPESIRRRFFPTESTHNLALQWMEEPSSPATPSLLESGSSTLSSIRFDLAGDPIPLDLVATLPTQLGLHHHGDSAELAGYTLADLFLLSRSTVPNQRTIVLKALAGLLSNLRRTNRKTPKGVEIPEVLLDAKTGLKDAAVGIAAHAFLDGRGMTLISAVDLLWEGLVAWDASFLEVEDDVVVEVEEQTFKFRVPHDAESFNSTLPTDTSSLPSVLLNHVLIVASNIINTTSPLIPSSSLNRLLQILLRLATYSRASASEFLKVEGLITGIIQSFAIRSLTTSERGDFGFSEPDTSAIRLVDAVAQSSREAAHRIVSLGIADNLLRALRVLSELPNAPISIETLNSQILFAFQTLKLYRTLAKYGIYANASLLASDVFSSLSHFVLSLHGLPPSDISKRVGSRAKDDITCSWLDLLDIWMVCARHPHCTSPPHAIRWVDVVRFGWSMDLFDLEEVVFRESGGSSLSVMTSLWNALAAWLEGAGVNSEAGGKEEKDKARKKLIGDGAGFGRGLTPLEASLATLSDDVSNAIPHAKGLRQVSLAARNVNAAVRLAASILERAAEPNAANPTPPPPIPIPIESTVALCRRLVSPNKLIARNPDSTTIPGTRNITSLLVSTLQYSLIVKYGSPKEWITLALQVLGCLVPGDEESGAWIVSNVLGLMGPQAGASLGWKIPEDVWKGAGLRIISPFLECGLLAQDETASGDEDEDELDATMVPVHLAPTSSSPETIAASTRIMYPPPRETFHSQGDGVVGKFGLPIEGGWVFSAIDELLRSGSSKAFKMLPRDWSSSEADVVRATLIFAGLFQAILGGDGASSSTFDHTEVVFACIKVFMLEHGQKEQDSGEEVFRDTFVNNAMLSLLTSTRHISHSPFIPSVSLLVPSTKKSATAPLERVARQLLGPRTPFYQMYTDFVALYDAISFSEPLFGALLIAPLAMSYAIDYRKILWVDYAHLVRSIRTEPTHPVFGASSKSGLVDEVYFYPVESDGQVLNAYLGALCGGSGGGGVHGVLKTIALHHVACHIWPDLQASQTNADFSEELEGGGSEDVAAGPPPLTKSGGGWEEDRAKKLLTILVQKAQHDVIRGVILYSASRSSSASISNETKAERMEYVASWGGEALRGRLYALLKAA